MNEMHKESRSERLSRPTGPRPGFTTFTNSGQSGRTDSILGAELAWREFVDLIATDTAGEDSRYIRINPDICENPPKLDAIDRIGQLQNATQTALKRTKMKVQIRRVAHRLDFRFFGVFLTDRGDVLTEVMVEYVINNIKNRKFYIKGNTI